MKDRWCTKRRKERLVYTVIENKMSDTRKREYKITQWEFWYIIFKQYKQDDILYISFLCHQDKWNRNKSFARNFYKKEDAEWYLVLIRRKDKNAESDS